MWLLPVMAGAFAGGEAYFRNVATSAGLVHSFPNGGDRTKQWILETTGSGAAMITHLPWLEPCRKAQHRICRGLS